MESNVVDFNSNIELIKDYFKNNLESYKLISEASHGPYWIVKFIKDYIEIIIYGDIGFTVEIIIDNTKYELWQYDRRVNNKMKNTEENILFQLDILKNFLSEAH